MTKKSLCYLVRISIIAVALCGLFICLCAYPFGVALNGLDATEPEMWIQMVFYWISALPCFAILGIGWRMSSSLKGEFFTHKNARMLERAGYLLFCDAVFYLAGNVGFMIIGQNIFAIFSFMMVAFALVVSLAFFAAGHYVARAASLREENESYI
ncbi:MAG: DUF2975 domain-containing protein [Clostridia bacterium]|nr:DUF2975 domain-containing protein [Clostridia bacterium]